MDVEFASVSEVERERAIGTLVLAFTADPFVRWIYPEASQYLSRFPEALQAFGGVAFGQGGVWRLGDFAAVALWLPPGIEPGGDATVALFQATVDSQKFSDLLGVFGQMEEAHPAMPHWYLPWFGVDCALQGQGLESRLMTPCLGIVDRDHLPAYLDSTNPRNVPFYERHGFAVTGRCQAGDGPPDHLHAQGTPLAVLTLRARACRRRLPADPGADSRGRGHTGRVRLNMQMPCVKDWAPCAKGEPWRRAPVQWPTSPGGGLMTEVIDQLVVAMNAHDLDAAAGFFHQNYHSEQPVHPGRAFTGRAQMRANWEAMFAGIPDFHAEICQSAQDGETAWTEWRWSGTRSDGQAFAMRGVTLFEITDGQIVAGRLYMEDVERDVTGIEQAVEALSGRRPRPAQQ